MLDGGDRLFFSTPRSNTIGVALACLASRDHGPGRGRGLGGGGPTGLPPSSASAGLVPQSRTRHGTVALLAIAAGSHHRPVHPSSDGRPGCPAPQALRCEETGECMSEPFHVARQMIDPHPSVTSGHHRQDLRQDAVAPCLFFFRSPHCPPVLTHSIHAPWDNKHVFR